MHIWKDTQKLCNPNVPYESSGIRHIKVPAELYEEIADDLPPTPTNGFTLDEEFYRTEDWSATQRPYIVWTRKDQAQLDAIAAAKAKQAAKAAATGDVEADIVCRYLREHTPLETYQYVQANVTDLASAKAIIGKLAAAVGVLLR